MIALLSVMAGEVFAANSAGADTPVAPAAASTPIPGNAPQDPSSVARGKKLFGANCAFCHGSNARGGEIGPNLLTSTVVRNDTKGVAIAKVVQNGRIDKGMPKFALSMDQVSDIAAFLHGMGPVSPQARPETVIPGGNPVAGRAYFYGQGHCGSCHSVTGDLAGIGGKFNWMNLQDLIVTGGSTGMLGVPVPGASPSTVRVILASEAVIDGQLDSIDDFDVTLTDRAGRRRTFARGKGVRDVEVRNPYEPHYELLKANREQVVHDLTAYLEGLK